MQSVSPSIVTQPANESVPMGLSGTFTVHAVGTSLQYQWDRNGQPIAGATATSYTTPATAFSDTGGTFTVTITNSSGTVISNAATLTVTARAPKPGDLRFQQVDAASTINGYSVSQGLYSSVVGCPPPGGGGLSTAFPSATGTGFFLSNDLCSWQYSVFALPDGASGLGVGYSGIPLAEYQDTLNGPTFINIPGPSDPASVVTSLSLYQSYAVGLGFIHSSTSSGFLPMQHIVAGSNLQALATQEGLSGRVITAVSYDGTNATAFSYGWAGDPSAVYESSVIFATLDTATADIQQMASQGYIITATGCTQAPDGSGVVLIGTRVQGDTMARPILVGDELAGTVDPLLANGYAIVAVVEKFQNNALVLKNYIGER
ncbi:MAG TPA: hypothetical protein VN612_14730 [Acidobacteriaceae bacterium]|nr:hypothetical protein [Acidobacteriaceae bacterium]